MRLIRISGLPCPSRQYGTTEPNGNPGIDREWVDNTPRYSPSRSFRARLEAFALIGDSLQRGCRVGDSRMEKAYNVHWPWHCASKTLAMP
jgi:hypothetical protein